MLITAIKVQIQDNEQSQCFWREKCIIKYLLPSSWISYKKAAGKDTIAVLFFRANTILIMFIQRDK